MNRKPANAHSSAIQILWAMFVVLVALWVIAFAAHLGGGLITYLLIVSLAALLIHSATTRSARPAPAPGENENDGHQ